MMSLYLLVAKIGVERAIETDEALQQIGSLFSLRLWELA
jgi:hypothetical protein